MVKEYLNGLKSKGNFSWNDLTNLSGLPEATIRKVFSGETADPRLDTVVKLVTAMGGSLDELVGTERKAAVKMNAIISVKEVYEARIEDIKASAAAHIESLKRDKRYLTLAVGVLGAALLVILLVDLLTGNMGWIRY